MSQDPNYYGMDKPKSGKQSSKNPYLSDNYYNNFYTPSDNTANQGWEMPNYSDPYSNVYSDPNQGANFFQPVDPYNPYSNMNDFQQTQQPQVNTNNQTSNQFSSPMPAFDPNLINNQFMAAGAQFFQNQMTNYSQDLVNKGKSWFDNSLKYYFAVDTGYVLKKLLLLFFPFAQKDWLPKYSSNEPVAPRDDINVPDLYIPCMAFVTYILAAGSIFGLKNTFSPEKLGIQASYAFFWLSLEVMCCLILLYLMNIRNTLSFFHLLSFCSYKFVFMIVSLLAYAILESSYYWILIYSSVSLGYFLIRSLNTFIQTNPNAVVAHNSTKIGLYLILGLAFVQPFFMYWMTNNIVKSASM